MDRCPCVLHHSSIRCQHHHPNLNFWHIQHTCKRKCDCQLESRPLLVFVDGRVHLGKSQMAKDEELRSLLRKRGYRILELCYDSYSDRRRDQLYEEIQLSLGKLTD